MFKKIRSRMLSGLLVLTMVFSMASPALAAEESGEETVAAETVEAAAETESEETGAETDAETETGDAAEDTETFTETEEVTVTVDDDSDLEELLSSMADNDELFDSYVSQLFYGGRSSYANYGYRLFKNDEINYPIYLALREQISAIAAGTQTSTQITIDLSDYGLTYTADELGIEASSETTELKSYGTAALGEDLLYGKIVYCLLVDCPYEMYWFSKTSYSVGWSMSFSGTSSAYTSITFTSITFNFPVISDYQDSTAYTLSTSGVERAQTAVENAQQIVGNHDSESDEDKLTSYRDEICDLVTYNTEAATDEYKATYGYGDPWGLVYVFDEDDTTNVVCEGYSKAFQYLCDLGLSEETVCYTVTGTMTGGTGSGGHMWNIVTLNGGNYLVDVTNSDSGTIGQSGGLFLVNEDDATSTAYDDAGFPIYTFTIGTTNIMYEYDTDTEELFSDDADKGILTLSASSSDTGDSETVSIESAEITLSADSFEYDGTAQEPEVTVTYGETTLTEGTDYTVAYADNTNAGTATVTITGTGNYTGSLTKDFTITAADISDYTVTLSATSYTYDGTEEKPEATVAYGETTLTEGTDYTVSYSNNTNAGTATVTITGTGNYTGTLTKTFTITQADISGYTVTLSTGSYTYDGSAKEPAVTVGGLTSSDYMVSYSNNTDAGTARVTITGIGNYTGTITTEFTIEKATQTVTAEASLSLSVNGTGQISPATDATGAVTYTFESQDTSIAIVDEDGLVTGVATGSTIIVVTASETDNYKSASATVAVTVNAVSISACNIELDAAEYTYNGTIQNPTVTVTYDSAILTEGTDYILSYANESSTTAGKYTVTISGINNFSGTAEKTYTINQADISDYTVTLSTTSYTYDGMAKEPGVTVTYDGVTLTEETDYTVDYADNTDAGNATVTVTGTGNYTGTLTKTFAIEKATQTVTATETLSVLVNGTGQISPATDATGDVTYTFESNDTSIATVTEDGVVTGVAAGSTTIVVTAVVDNYENATANVMVVVTAAATELTSENTTITVPDEELVYDGDSKEPSVTVIYDSMALTQDEDYEVSYENNINAGDASVTITGKGIYSGTVTKVFTIAKATQTITPETASTELVCGETFEIKVSGAVGMISYESSDEAVATVNEQGVITAVGTGTADITVTAAETDNYNAASATVAVTVNAVSISACGIALGAIEYTYNGAIQKPTVTVTYDSATLTEGTDYTLSYENESSTAVGEYTVTIEGINNFSGTAEKTYTINRASISGHTVTLSTTSYTYDGSAKKPTVTVSGLTSSNYTVSYSNNTNAGTATVTITGTGNYTGTLTKTFTINRASISGYTATLSATSYNWDGAVKTPTVTVKNGSTVLAGSNYTVTYASGRQNLGTYTVTVTGTGNYTGSLTTSFTISAAQGSTYTVGSYRYQVTSGTAATTSGTGTVTITGGTSSSLASIAVADTVVIGGRTYQVTAIGSGAFKSYTSAASISIGKYVTSIGSQAFYGCKKATKVTGCAAVTSVGKSAFQGCSKLSKVAGLQKATSIGSKAFYGCTKLKQIGSSSKKITLAKVKTIGSSAFYKCTTLTSVNLTSTQLTTIDTSAFQGCTALKTFVSKSAKLAKIGKKAFCGDKKLASVTLRTSKLTSAKVGASAFKGIKSSCTFKVPKAKISAYKKIFKAKGAGSKIKVKKS